MLLQTNSYIVPKDKRSEHARLLRKFRQTLTRLGCTDFEVYEQVGANWATGEATGRFVQIMRFRDRKHQQEVQAGERSDPVAQQLIQEFCALINFPYQQQQGLFAVGFYSSSLPTSPSRPASAKPAATGMNPAAPSQRSAPSAEPSAPAAAQAPVDLPEPKQPESKGSSLLDFSALAPGSAAAEQPAPLSLADDAGEADVVESTIPSPDDAAHPPALPAPAVEDAANGEHTGSFSDTPEAMLDLVNDDADPDDLSDADREAVLGELTGEDAETGRKGRSENR